MPPKERTDAGGGEGRPRPLPEVVRHDEEATVERRLEEVGRARIRREVDQEHVRERHPRGIEQLAEERVPVEEGDSGEIETLPDGSISIPLFEERLEVVRRKVLRERVIVRKELVTEWETVEADLRRERLAVDADDGTAV